MDELVARALHAARRHFADGGTLSDLFSGSDYLSNGEVASFANMPTQGETTADFFKADKAMRLAQQAQAPEAAPLTAPRPGAVEVRDLPSPPVNIPLVEPKTMARMPDTPATASFASQPLAFAAEPEKNPARVAIEDATKIANRAAPEVAGAGDVWARMLRQESGNRQFRPNGSVVTSPAGALGISQVMPTTGPEAAQLAGLPWSLERLRTDPEYNQALGRAYYDAQLARFGDPVLAAAAYNGGPGRVAQALRQAQATGRPWTDFLKPETQNYVRVVGRAEGGKVDAPDEVNQALDVVRQVPETNALGMTPDQFAEYTQTKAPPTPGFIESALRNVREYAMPRGEDYTHAMDQSAAAADYLTKSGKEGMLSGNPLEIAKGAGMSMLGTALPVIAPVGAAIEAGVVNPAGRVLGPAGRQAAEVATMVPGEGATAAMKIARATGEAAPIATAMSIIPKATETATKSIESSVGKTLFEDASQMPKKDFVEKYRMEIEDPRTASHQDFKDMEQKHKTSQPHYKYDPKQLDPFELDSWDEALNEFSSKHVQELQNAIKNKADIPPILVEGSHLDKKYRPMVVDGHHRTIANLKENVSEVPLFFTNKTLKQIWDHLNQQNRAKGGSVVDRALMLVSRQA